MPIPAFLSYSHNDRQLAGSTKGALDYYGFECSLAHEDLLPSQEWQDEILGKLISCEVFFPLLTQNSRSSMWTDQETEIANCFEKDCRPLESGVEFLRLHRALPSAIPDRRAMQGGLTHLSFSKPLPATFGSTLRCVRVRKQ
jgi:hypothetical protein